MPVHLVRRDKKEMGLDWRGGKGRSVGRGNSIQNILHKNLFVNKMKKTETQRGL